MRCPVCKGPDDGIPLYQISYPGYPEYVTPRCEVCLEKLYVRREEKRIKKGGQHEGPNA